MQMIAEKITGQCHRNMETSHITEVTFQVGGENTDIDSMEKNNEDWILIS